MGPYYAHSGKDKDNRSDWQVLRDHLREVAKRAKESAQEARRGEAAFADAAWAAGLLHDLGKYREEFQQMLKGLHPPRERTFHKQAGAARAADARNSPVAFAIAGHHGGIPNSEDLKGQIAEPSGRAIAAAIWGKAVCDCPELGTLPLGPPLLRDNLSADLFTRLLFSCLVDADWEDTGGHERRIKGLPPEPPTPNLESAARLECVLAHIRTLARACKEPYITELRANILSDCLAAAERPPGLFSLTVPTGGGKTLSGLAFALKHATAHRLRRVIYVAPYLTILEQNARAIRSALQINDDDPAVFEHHSLAEPSGGESENETGREAAVRRAENWDAPVIITTNVQFFESLFSNKPGRCRKLHNIARSVIVLDECQTLPPELVAPTCSMLGQLATMLGCTVVLCTATQPAFDHTDIPEPLRNLREIIPTARNLFSRLRRVQVSWPKREDPRLDWPSVARKLRERTAALCIVNTRRAARELFMELKKLGGDVFHLSTSMCPLHRLMILDEVRRRLNPNNPEPCYLVATQLIEAGVDVDFPFLMRELAPLEAIIQAAGRCDREGRLTAALGSPGGQVMVFRSEEGAMPSDRWYYAGRSVLETSFLNADREPQIDTPEDIREYFERLYRTGDLDQHDIQTARERSAFKDVAKDYRLIENDGDPVVVANWKEKQKEIEALMATVRSKPMRGNFRKLTPYQVNLRRYELNKLDRSVTEEAPGLFVWRGGYDSEIGLTADNVDTLLLV